MLHFSLTINCKAAYRRFVEISNKYSYNKCDMYHIGATYMDGMVGNPTLDILLLVPNFDQAPKGDAFKVWFDGKLKGVRVGDVFYYVGLLEHKAHLLRYKYLTEYINVHADIKLRLRYIKLNYDSIDKNKFFKQMMPGALKWAKKRQLEPVDPKEEFPLAVVGQEMKYLKNFITRPNIKVGDYTYYSDLRSEADFENDNVLYHYDPNNKLIIGKFCSIADGVKFFMSNANHQSDGTTYPFAVFSERWAKLAQPNFPTAGDTVVGNDVWIGNNVTIMPGVKIGDGAIIAANATVTRDVPAYHIAGGVPAKIIKPRFSAQIIEFYLQLNWWDWPIEKIEQNMRALVSGDVEALKKVG